MTRNSLAEGRNSLVMDILQENASRRALGDCYGYRFENVALMGCEWASHIAVAVDNNRRPLVEEANWMER